MIQPLSRVLSDAYATGRTNDAPVRRQATETSGQSGTSFEEVFTETAETPTSSLASKQTFLTLLVAQIKNQNPLNPADGTEFLSQLAQFSELEQLISIREELEAINQAGGTLTGETGSTDDADTSGRAVASGNEL